MTEAKAIKLPVDEIEASAAIQVRVRIDPRHVERLKDAIENGAIVPPLVVYAEPGSERYLLADGFHRLKSLKGLDIKEVACELREGGIREALEYALSANDTHGLPLSNHDKRNAVEIALKDPEWGEWSATEIARLCRVSDTFVRKVRDDLVLKGEINAPDTVKTVRDGEVVEQKASAPRSNRSTSSNSSKKSETPPKRNGPKSQDQADREEFDAALTAINSQVHDGREKARRWYSVDRKHKADLAAAYLEEFVAGCEKIEKNADAA